MKFIFPRNYNFKAKLFGIFDYFTIIINIIFFFISLTISRNDPFESRVR